MSNDIILAYGPLEQKLNIEKKSSISHYIDFEGNFSLPMNQPITCHCYILSCIPTFLVTQHKASYMKVIVNNLVMHNIPLEFCNNISTDMSNMHIDTEKYIYNLPWTTMNLTEIPLVASEHENQLSVRFEINNINNEPVYGKLYYNINNYKINQECAPIYKLWKTIQSRDTIITNNTRYRLYFNGTIKGIYLENLNIDTILSFNIKINDHYTIQYDNDALQILSKKMFKNCYYISFDNEDQNNTDFSAGINYECIDNLIMEIDSAIDQYIIIHAITGQLCKDAFIINHYIGNNITI